ncbi:unnamed protein product [Camellia sinensis]
MQHQLMQMQQQQQQQPMVMTTDHIQQYLDENKWLILKILENQNSGKLSENAENQARLQQNLMYLAAIADCQPQMSFVFDQFTEVIGSGRMIGLGSNGGKGLASAFPRNKRDMQQQHPMYLDENKWLILKILENQNSGKLSERAGNQAKLQQNLMHLAAIADCQPQTSFMFDQ